MIDITVLFLEGGYISTAINAVEVFRSAGVFWNLLNGDEPSAYFNVRTASLNGRAVVPDGPMAITPQYSLDEIEHTDLIFVPASGVDLEMMVSGYDIDAVLSRNAGVVPWIKDQAEKGAQIAAVCSGTALVAKAGLLDGKRGTMHWAFADIYARKFPKVDWQPDYLVTDSTGIYCGGGINSAADLSLYLVEKFCGREVAVGCAKSLLLEMPRTWQMAFALLDMNMKHDDEVIHRAQAFIHDQAVKSFRFEDVAVSFGMSPRNFNRRFKDATGDTPVAYLQKLRIAKAKRLLETGRASIQKIALEVGYEDLIFFRSLFKRLTGLTPGEYRRRFGV
ncbi:GlxA family transcriptional regulator [Flexibacterium corallicola]|uniref:GlxA family transcriptional regulator n=1 Tax=Flexibacterium corallicola TaxID=3037259 RepID=UPI00286FA6E0|nr:helix-turn-helix domain-containing protein [Pseudovibrio sp. M1P-2-3]